GTYADLAAVGGTTVNISETNNTPGFDVEIAFSNLPQVTGFHVIGYYAGGATHVVDLEAYNEVTSAWDKIYLMPTDTMFQTFYVQVPKDVYISGSGTAKIRFYHYSPGVNTHDLYLDYIAVDIFE
ncbi:MAG: hypothetical protein ACWGQW_21620, partial [bacterium]